MNKKDAELELIKESYYSIFLAFEVSKDVLNDTDIDVVTSRNLLYSKINELIPSSEYETFSSSVVVYQIEDSYNYLITYSSFIRSNNRLPMDGYINTRSIKDEIKNEFIEFFNSINLEYKLVNIKSLV